MRFLSTLLVCVSALGVPTIIDALHIHHLRDLVSALVPASTSTTDVALAPNPPIQWAETNYGKCKKLDELRKAVQEFEQKDRLGAGKPATQRQLDDMLEQKAAGFTYVKDIFDRVVSATGLITELPAERAGKGYEPQCANMVYSMYYLATKQQLDGQEYNVGHIIANQIGGSETSLYNYFPHHVFSNTRGGAYYRMERIAQTVAGLMTDVCVKKLKMTCYLGVEVTFKYGTNAAPDWIATEGTYELFSPVDCFEKCLKALDKKVQEKSYVSPFITHATKSRGAYRFINDWLNKEDHYQTHPQLKKIPKTK